jgi:hypothetical protein
MAAGLRFECMLKAAGATVTEVFRSGCSTFDLAAAAYCRRVVQQRLLRLATHVRQFLPSRTRNLAATIVSLSPTAHRRKSRVELHPRPSDRFANGVNGDDALQRPGIGAGRTMVRAGSSRSSSCRRPTSRRLRAPTRECALSRASATVLWRQSVSGSVRSDIRGSAASREAIVPY